MNREQIVKTIEHLEAQIKEEKNKTQRAEPYWYLILGILVGLAIAILLLTFVS